MSRYNAEARSRWGNTDAYREHEQKTKKKGLPQINAKPIL